jgi:hypothetical protein
MSTEEGSNSKVKVVVRLRPTLKEEKSGASCVTLQDKSIQLVNLKSKISECYSYR